ncbi:Clr5 domain-containing protein [Xylaria intraflava]|nr:Clr5 domain-containing protein [Xylaria intraflava]
MQTTSSQPTQPRPSGRVLVPLRHKNIASKDRLRTRRLDIPVQVVPRQIEHAKQHAQDEWDAMKPMIQRLYINERRPLRSVMRTMAEEYGFYATNKMYKTRFTLWGWRKNRIQGPQHVAVSRIESTRTTAIQRRIQHLTVPELLNDQEVPISISRNYTIDLSGSQRWNCIVLNMSEPSPSGGQNNSIIRFCDAETAYVNTIHQLRSGRIQDAFQCLNKLFDSMTGSKLYLHPKYLTGFWLLCHGVYNACTWINDADFNLLRELLCFHGQNAATCFQTSATPSSHPVVSLMRSVARMSRDNPSVMKQTFRNAYRAAAESLEEKLGPNHPVVLVTWTDYFWYFNFPVDAAKNLVARQETALREAELTAGREADVTICLLHNFVFFLFYCIDDSAQARKKLADLLQRISRRIASQTSATSSSFHLQRAFAFGSLLLGIFVLQEHGDVARCQGVIGATIEWLKCCEGSDAPMHAKMLEMDLLVLTKAWKEGKDLRDLTLAFSKPRSADYNDQKPRRERQQKGEN